MNWFISQNRSLLERLNFSNESTEYIVWRNQFLRRRLGLFLCGGIPLWFCATISDIYKVFFSQDAAKVPNNLATSLMMENAVYGLFLFASILIYRSKFGHRYPSLLFLFVSCSCTLIQQLCATINGFALPNTSLWALIFMAQAVLIPVCWRLHFTSQLATFGYYIVVNSILSLPTINGKSLISLNFLIYIFWFYLICNTGIYLYERLQKSEFASKREMQAFLRAIYHDLRAPLMGTSVVLQNILRKPESDIIINRRIIERLLEGNARQLDLINLLLEMRALESQQVKLHCKPLQLSEVITCVLSDLEPLLTENRITVKNFVTQDLPLINADATQLERVISNFITNALKHNPYAIEITIDANAKGKRILCRFSDNGVGISQDQCKRIFEPYTRGEKSRFMPGLGLGLYICRQIITAHGGKIGVTSHLGSGSMFWFTLPVYNGM